MMSVMAQEGRWSRSAGVSTDSVAPTINANRRRLDREAPNLAFTITSQKPFVEIVLATDRTLFDPNRASGRAPHNFFASRAFGLTHMSGPDATYIVPTAVLRAFLEAQPRPREIFFTAIACDDEEGHGPVLALPLSQLVSSAPSVAIAADYTVQGLARSFGMALERLVRHEGTRALGMATVAPAAPAPSAPSRWQATGSIQVPVTLGADDDEAAPAVNLADIDADGFDRDESFSASSYEAPADEAPIAAPGSPPAAAAAEALDYDDGFGDTDDDHAVGAEPAELPDDDYASAYGDEADGGPEAALTAAADAAPGPADGAPVAAAPAPSATRTRPALPTAAQLRDVLARVAAKFDGGSLYTMARPSEAGLRFGVGAFDQRSGALGRLLAQMKASDAPAFTRFFGDGAAALLSVTGAATPEARMAPVAGKPLGDPAWTRRFVAAGAHPAFVQAQNELLVSTALSPLWPVASGLGLVSPRAIALVTVLAIHMGPQEAADWLTARLAPAHTQAQLEVALAAIGAPDLAAFQRQAGLAPSGRIDADTKAALTLALRALGASSPLPVLAPAQMLEAIRRSVGHNGVARKIASLMEDRALADQPR